MRPRLMAAPLILATTKVEVIARKNAVDYDRELAKTILNAILAK